MKPNILDTLRCTNHQILYKDFHIDRVVNSFNFFEMLIDVKKLIELYDRIESETDADSRVRIEYTTEAQFKTEISIDPFVKIEGPIKLKPALFGKQRSGEGLGNFKTTERHYWGQNTRNLTQNNGVVDVLGLNEQDFVTETSRFNLFLFDGKQFYTPTLDSGCLRGVFREYCLMNDGVVYQDKKYSLDERDFHLDEVKNFQIFVGNSVQGLLTAQLKKNI